MNAVVAQPAAVPRQFAARSALRRNAGKAASAAPARARRSVAVRAAGNNEDKTVAIASIAAFLAAAPLAAVADDFAPPAQEAPASALAQFQAQAQSALSGDSLTAPDTKVADPNALPEGNTWRYSEFIRAVMGGKVERVRFAKDGTSLQLTAVDGRRAQVTLPNDPELVDILAKNGVDISVSEGEQQGNFASLAGNLLFPLLAFGGLFFLFRRAQGGEGGGHTGEVATSILIPKVVDLCRGKTSKLTGGPILVVAAGGVFDGRGLAMSLSMGAGAVWVGTRFVASEEAGAPPRHKKGTVAAGYHDTIRTIIFTGRPMRVIKNDYIMGWEENRASEIKELTSKGVLPVYHDMEERKKKGEEMMISQVQPLLIGQAAGAIDDVKPAAEIMSEMVTGAIESLRGATAQISKL
mmetsp:Transcript_91318/g.221739  ORF Transcript_91318/g.221739 Transcript_91318/m.221739 type:complete len:409 (+) Transcript_91318:109-1335(+)